jgi:Ca-activated chloride channel family protein
LGLILRNSEFKANSSYGSVLNLAYGAKAKDKEGYRAEFIQLAEACKMLSDNGKYSQR